MLISRMTSGAIAALLALAATACAHAPLPPQVQLVEQDSGVDVRLRGLSAVNDQVAWASGGNGTVLRTIDGGRRWQVIKVAGAEELDFRDIEGFDAANAVVLSIGPGEASRVYRTLDGGETWALALQNRDPDAFLDCMAFDGRHGVILGDPVDGRFQIRETRDGGAHWTLRADGPRAAPGEAAFAASGTCIALDGDGIVFVTGGSQARVHYLSHQADGASRGSWQATQAAAIASLPSAGYFSVEAMSDGYIAVGGDYEQPDAAGVLATLALEPAGRLAGMVPSVVSQPPPAGYRSGIACVDDGPTCIATGPSGTDRLDGKQWSAISPLGFDAVDLAGSTGWVSGDGGRIGRIEIVPAAD